MRKICILLIFLILPILAYTNEIPQPVGWVNDFANVINPKYKDKLNSLIEELQQKTSVEIAVVTINSIAPYGEREYAQMLFDNWKPGKKGKDNGVLVLLAIKERRWAIETGYGMEAMLPDGACGQIARNYMVPYFKEGRYGEGLYAGVEKIYEIVLPSNATTGSKPAPRSYDLADTRFLQGLLWISLIVLLVLLRFFRWGSTYSGGGYSGSYGYYGGGFGGGGFGGFGGGSGGGGGAGGRF